MSRRRSITLPILLVLLASLALLPNAVAGQSIAPIDERAALLADELNTIDVIDRSGPSVVAVTVTVRGDVVRPRRTERREPTPEERFFGDGPRVRESSGSGFLIEHESEPYLVTNFHVVEGALEPGSSDLREGAEIMVTFPADADADVPVDVVGVNPSFDLALLRLIEVADLPAAEPLPIADSDLLRVGQKTVAIGNPFGLESSVTSGIVSAVGRFVPTVGQLPVPMIQTDAAINPGNSGGPLLDSAGRLIGINTALINPGSRSFAGLGFAVPSNLLLESLANLELGGVTDVSDTRPRLGIAAQSLALIPAGIREDRGLPEVGVAIIEVQAGSVAERAGLLGSLEDIAVTDDFEVPAPGDIIIAIDGDPVDSVEDITLKVTYESAAGDELVFTIIREGSELRIPIVLEVSSANAFEPPAG